MKPLCTKLLTTCQRLRSVSSYPFPFLSNIIDLFFFSYFEYYGILFPFQWHMYTPHVLRTLGVP